MTDIAAATAHRTATDRKAHGAHRAHKGAAAGAPDEGGEAAGTGGEFAALFETVTGSPETGEPKTKGKTAKTDEAAAATGEAATLPGTEVAVDPALQPTDKAPVQTIVTTADYLSKTQGKAPEAIGKAERPAASRRAAATETAPAETVRTDAGADRPTPVMTGLAEHPATSMSAAQAGKAKNSGEPLAEVTEEAATAPVEIDKKPTRIVVADGKSQKAEAREAARVARSADAERRDPATLTTAAQTAVTAQSATTSGADSAPARSVAANSPNAATDRPAVGNAAATLAQVIPQQDQGRTGADAGQSDGRRSGSGRGEAKTAAVTATDTLASTDGSAALRDIVQSLPPFIQAQLGGTDANALTMGATAAASAATPSTGELLSDKVIDMGVSGQWIDRMAREIAQLSEGTGHSRFQLSPPNLGRIQVDLWQGDDNMNLRIMTETDEAARRLREGQGALEANARMAALSLGSISVEKSSAPLDSGKDQNREQNNGQNQRQAMDFGGQPQQQAGQQAHGQSETGRSRLNNGPTGAVIANDQQAEATPVGSRGGTGDRNIRYA